MPRSNLVFLEKEKKVRRQIIVLICPLPPSLLFAMDPVGELRVAVWSRNLTKMNTLLESHPSLDVHLREGPGYSPIEATAAADINRKNFTEMTSLDLACFKVRRGDLPC